MCQGKRKILFFFLIATLQVIILQAAPANEATGTAAQPTANTQPSAASSDAQPPPASTDAQSSAASADTQSSAANASPASQETSAVRPSNDEQTADKPLKPTDPKPAVPKPNKPTDTKPSTLTNGATKPSSAQPFGSCWTCLLKTVEEICSYLTDWTSPKKIPALNLFSLFDGSSSEESAEDSVGTPGIASLFRFKRSVEDPAMAQEAFLELLDGFYVKARDRFASENPSLVLAGSDDLYNRPDEIVQVVAYVLGVPKDRLVQVFEKMKTRRTGEILLQALGDRHSALINGEEKLENKSIGGLNPTSISYFFKELLGSVNGVATGLSEIISVLLQNQSTNVQPNKVK